MWAESNWRTCLSGLWSTAVWSVPRDNYLVRRWWKIPSFRHLALIPALWWTGMKAHLEGIAELCSRLRTEAARVVAVGEIGIDTLVVKSTAQLDRQVAFLTELVRALIGSPDLRHLPLVLHVWKCDNTRRVRDTCLTVLKDAGVPQNNKVYRHSFLGDHQEAQDWFWMRFPTLCLGYVLWYCWGQQWSQCLSTSRGIACWWRQMLHTSARRSTMDHAWVSTWRLPSILPWFTTGWQVWSKRQEWVRRHVGSAPTFFDCVVLHKKNWGSSCSL